MDKRHRAHADRQKLWANYVESHFPEMELKVTGIEWSDTFGDYLIFCEDDKGETYSCVIGLSFFPFILGQGTF